MTETRIAFGLFAALGLLAGLLATAPTSLMIAGFWITAAGLAFGVPTGAVYHLALRRALLGAQRLPPRWWLHPTSLHGEIPASARSGVLGWCYAGAAGFLVTIAGCGLVAIAAFRGI